MAIVCADTKAQLKKLEVFVSGRSVYTWETVTVDDYPCVIVVSKTDLLLWGHEILRAIVDSETANRVEKLTGADTVVAEWMNGRIEVMTDDNSSHAAKASVAQTVVRTSALPSTSIMVVRSRASASLSTNSTRTPASEGGFSGTHIPSAALSRNSSGAMARTDAIGSATVKVAPLPSPPLAA